MKTIMMSVKEYNKLDESERMKYTIVGKEGSDEGTHALVLQYDDTDELAQKEAGRLALKEKEPKEAITFENFKSNVPLIERAWNHFAMKDPPRKKRSILDKLFERKND